MRLPVLTLLLAVASCGGGGIHPDDTTAEGHRRAADHERTVAENEISQHDRAAGSAEAVVPATGGGTYAADGAWVYPRSSYDPQHYLLDKAERHAAHARAHEAAAAELEKYEQEECAQFPPETRASCPILGPVVGFTEIAGGVRVTLQPGVSVAAATAHMRCHLAYARAHGYEPDCPLYMKGVHVTTTPDGQGVAITTDDAKAVGELRRRARAEIVVGAPAPSTL